ncbi:MAG: 4Fe-4S dicluster domain-containing protein [Bradymonadia bacterium]
MFAGPWDLKRVKSFIYLAIAFWKRQGRRLVKGRRDNGGAKRFIENYSEEGMAPLSGEQAALVHALSQCIYCGLCEAVCPSTPDRWAAYSRALAEARHAAATIPAACPEGCRKCEAVCPTGVPLWEIPAFVHRNGVVEG